MVAKFDTIRSKGFAAITNSYTILGAQYDYPLRMFRIINDTDGNMFISVDGTTNQFYLPKGTFVLYDIAANSIGSIPFVVPAKTQFYVKYSSAPSLGSVYVEGIYSNIQTGYDS